jgi:hypothetical protein
MKLCSSEHSNGCQPTRPDDMAGYYVGLDPAGSVMLGRMNYAWTQLASSPATIGTNVWRRLRVTMQGSALKVYVNNLTTPKITWTDSTHRRGQIGVRAFQCNAQFDNVTFTNAAPLRVELQRSDTGLAFSWPQTAFNLALARTPSLSAVPDWLPVTNPAALSNGRWSLSLPWPKAAAEFYRLQPRAN